MSKEIDCKKWISLYTYFKGDIYEPECDKIILDIVENIVNYAKSNKLFEKFFFIRYSENGPHVRLRFWGEQFLFTNVLIPYIEDFIKEYKPRELLSYPSPSSNQSQNNSSIIWVDYEPEIERYGGNAAIKVAEDFFFYSSEAAVELIKQLDGNDRSQRLGKGLITTLLLVYVFLKNREESSKFFYLYSSGYLSTMGNNEGLKSMYIEAFDNGFDKQSEKLIAYINSIWDALDEGQELPETLEMYKRDLLKIKSDLFSLFNSGRIITKNGDKVDHWFDCTRMIVSSYVHMMNNRLGVSIREEAYISHLIKKTLLKEKTALRNENDK